MRSHTNHRTRIALGLALGLALAAPRRADAAACSLAAPTGVNAASTCTSVDLTWSAVTGAASYAVYRTTGACPFANGTPIGSSTTTSFSDTTAVPGTTYSYFLRTVCTNGKESANSACVTGALSSAPAPPATLTAVSSADGVVTLTWPTAGGLTYNVYRYDGAACAGAATQIAAGLPVGTYDATGLTPGNYYSFIVKSASTCESATGSPCASAAVKGTHSAGRTVSSRPQDTSTGRPVRWIFNTAASALTPPGIGPAVFAVSNDRSLHSMEAGTAAGAGTWPTSPAQWKPLAMNAPAQARPPVISASGLITGHPRLVYLGSQDGRVYCADADTGALVVSSGVLGDYVQSAANGIFQAYGGAYDLVFVGTRNASSANAFYGLAASTLASTAGLTFTNAAGQGGDGTSIGIVSGDAQVDYATSRVYFTSRKFAGAGGSPSTVWCLSFAGGSAFTLAWAKDYGNIDGGATLSGDGSVLYVGNNAGEVYAIEASTGNKKWKFSTGDGAVKGYVWADWATPNLFFSTYGKVWGLADGGAAYGASWSVAVANPSMPLFVNGLDRLYVGSSDGALHEIDTTTQAARSVTVASGAVIGSPALDVPNAMLYVGTDSGDVYASPVPLP